MKFMLMMHAPRAGWTNAGIGTWPPEDIKAHIRFMMDFNRELSAAGELVEAQGLNVPEEARIVRAGKGGAPEITDGPYPEAKEFLAGYWIVDVDSPERAYAVHGGWRELVLRLPAYLASTHLTVDDGVFGASATQKGRAELVVLLRPTVVGPGSVVGRR